LLLKKRGAEFDPLPLLSDTFDFAAKAPFVNSGDRISELLKAGLTPEALASFVVYLQALKEREELHKLIAVNIHGKTLIGQLCELAAIKNTGIDASEAITALLLQLTVPSSAEQGNAGTCGVMGPLGLISILEPGNVAGLFIRECYRNGATIDEESGEVRLDQNLSIHLHERTPFNAALQTTLINEAALGGTYKSDIDRIFVNGPDQTLIEHGVRTEWIAQLLTEQLKIPYEADFRPDPAALLERLTKCKNLGIAVLSWPQRFNQSEKTSYAAHAVWILDVTTDGVLFYNSQGPSPLEIPKGYRNGPDGNKSLGFNLYEMDLKSFGYNLLGIVAPKEGIDISGYKNRVDSGLACGLRLYDLLRNVEK
jgi:hypothetical protein